MTLNVFYSWQSDLHAKTNNYFIKNCLKRAIKKLNKSDDIEIDAPIRIDHDTKDVPGQPTIFEVIVSKIENCSVFVADFSLVGVTDAGKKLTNSNVSIEYGVALQALGSEHLVTVMNTAYGLPTDLPFDLQHKRWPSLFNLPEDANAEQERTEREKLVEALYQALKAIFKHSADKVEDTLEPTIVETPFIGNPALFFDIEEPVFKDNFKGSYQFHKNDAYAYLKVIPTVPQQKLTAKQMNDAMHSDPILMPFTHFSNGFSFFSNKYGAVNASTEGRDQLVYCLSQVMKNTREIWGVNSHLLYNSHVEDMGDVQYIPSIAIEKAFVQTLENYLKIAIQKLNITSNVKVVAGFTGIDGYRMALSNRDYSNEIHEEKIEMDFTIDPKDTNPEQLLKPFFKHLWEECGLERPDNLR